MYVLPGKPCVFCSFWQLRLKMTLCLGPLLAGMGSGVSECVDVPCTCVLKMILAHVVQLDTRKFWQMRRGQKIQKEVL